MRCVAVYEVKSEASVVRDGMGVEFRHAADRFKARLKNIPRKDYSIPFLLSLELTFESPVELEEGNVDAARDAADQQMVECLNMLTLVTGAAFRRHRILRIVDLTPQPDNGMHRCLMWADSVEGQDPQPMLHPGFMKTIERLVRFDAPRAVQRALSWYRLGVIEDLPDDQFQYFWLGLEILAEHAKGPEKVTTDCPACKSPLFCQKCEMHPTHRRFAKQAIQALAKSVHQELDDGAFEILESARNALMHGRTLDDVEVKIEGKLPKPFEHIVDFLGEILFKALMNQYPKEFFAERLQIARPSTYIHRSMTSVALLELGLRKSEGGELDVSFEGVKATFLPDGPPQSAVPSVLSMTREQHERLGRLKYREGDHQDLCRRVHEKVQERGGRIHALVLSTDADRIREVLKSGEKGEWQDLFREIAGDAWAGSAAAAGDAAQRS